MVGESKPRNSVQVLAGIDMSREGPHSLDRAAVQVGYEGLSSYLSPMRHMPCRAKVGCALFTETSYSLCYGKKAQARGSSLQLLQASLWAGEEVQCHYITGQDDGNSPDPGHWPFYFLSPQPWVHMSLHSQGLYKLLL